MSIFTKQDPKGADPLQQYQQTASPKKRKRYGRNQILRADQLEKLVESGQEIDEQAIISMYRPQRKARRFGAALLRMDKLRLLVAGLILLVAILFIFSFMQEKMGNFTISLNRLELYRKGISISADADFSSPTARLVAGTVPEATNISIADLPDDLDAVDGDHNGLNYMAYTYYVRNAGKVDLSYEAVVTLDSAAKGAENAVRVAIWKNGERQVYATPSSTGAPEPDCTNFLSQNVVCTYTEEDFKVGYVDKYTIAIWLEGDDPECVDAIVGGSVQFSMDIHAVGKDDSTLLTKYIRDIWDTLKEDKPINAAGNDAPDYYYTDREITYATRRNQ